MLRPGSGSAERGRSGAEPSGEVLSVATGFLREVVGIGLR